MKKQRPPAEIAEIERHKYLESEKAGHDVGWEFAERDWEAKFGDTWRRQHPPVRVDQPNSGGHQKRGLRGILSRVFSR